MKVLVCGTNYGATYIRALQFQNTGLMLSGILSTGSLRSTHYAQSFAVPHYTDVEQITDQQVDIACVAIAGDAGIEIATALLKKHIHVICEHPIGQASMTEVLTVAKANGVRFWVNAHFGDLYPIRFFYDSYFSAASQGQCMHLDLAVNLRTLYSGLDLICRLFADDVDVTIATQPQATPGAFASILLQRGSMSISLLCQNFASEFDDGSATFINHRVSAIFNHGTLLLSDTYGPLTWLPSPITMSSKEWRSHYLLEQHAFTVNEIMTLRDKANLAVLEQLKAVIYGNGECPHFQKPNYLMALAKLWENVYLVLNGSNAN
ncbi:Gfo/Idh/MocA family oxidoreductase [Pseudoalteromonas piscicida]|uniref:Siderophore-like synthase n=1 Tax=Pseudoalteromonas piscicida TaxID=43662 RepID=A0A2A5JKG6_PSEO7|nr:Gfo/Idh/MocA family oxidoreductase [Pseudoalteromonas piscicida]PCK29731.1 siderophore-like synthase [Pseudoalteromonas piscicida]